ncbi:FadR/GntR family transcriptional regulator [Tropicibacter alexandrii]|uniref:FadR/GntR family transcriptional regulator n=1 Tax=Tropicibacter alexandrii TaxID=2267683 RepID=UPI000EF51D46|nr:FadR/GntR family transcriptional regulator [Tropicibacter alexandrii]
MAETKQKRGTLVVTVLRALRARIERGEFKPGDRLPSEAQLTAEFDVSRTVVREAIASLRADGLVEPRQGAGVFVLDRQMPTPLPFHDVDPTRVSSVIELLEVRAAVEVEAAGLAAQRRSPAQEERIIEAFRTVSDLAKQGEPTSEADFDLHLAIAEATNNARFTEFLRMLGPSVIPRRALRPDAARPTSGSYQQMIDNEHREIVNAILTGDPDAAREAMRTHLQGSMSRYRALLRETVNVA